MRQAAWNRNLDEASRRIKKLQDANIAAQTDLENEKKKRLQLAASLLPRYFFDQSGAIAALRKFSPPSLIIFEYLEEHEVRDTAQQINAVFNTLKWEAWRCHEGEDSIKDGVWISFSSSRKHAPDMDSAAFLREIESQRELANSLKQSLIASGIEAETEMSIEAEQFSLGTLVIRVGPKPNREVEIALRELGGYPKPPFSDIGGVRVKLSGGRAAIREINGAQNGIPKELGTCSQHLQKNVSKP